MELLDEGSKWSNELEFTKILAESIRECSIRSKKEQGTNVTRERLSEPRDVTRVDVDSYHPHNSDAGRPDLAIYYEGDPLPRLYRRTLSNPFFIECKMGQVEDEVIQALKYKWRNGDFQMDKYSGDSVGMTSPNYLEQFKRGGNRKFRVERYLWHAGIGVLRQGHIEDRGEKVVLSVLAFNEEEHVIFEP